MTRRAIADISYEVVRSKRRTADIVIERDGRVVVRAPETIVEERIDALVEDKIYWIYKNLAEWCDLNATRVRREFRNGESFLYLGRSYRLMIVFDQEVPLQLRDGRFCLRRDVFDVGTADAPKNVFREYYIALGVRRLSDRVSYFAPKVGVLVERVVVKELGNRWASCSVEGEISFHWKCVMAPQTIIDYIVVHELCHLHHFDHTEAFWNEVDKVMPNYRERKEWLRKHGAGLDV